MALPVHVLCGPTASGKSPVALHLAKRLGAEILSIDSMKIYKRLDIGTAKPDAAARAAVRHHLIDVREPWESFSVAEFLQAAEQLIADAARAGRRLLCEGGTALYLKALAEGLFAGPGRDPELRAQLEAEAEAAGLPRLHEKLRAVDPQAAAKILPGDLRRIVRALEVHALTGVPISRWQAQWGVPRADLDVRMVCLRLPRAELYARIDRRVQAMLDAGWLDECRALVGPASVPAGVGRDGGASGGGPPEVISGGQGRPPHHPLSREALQALGYRTLFAHLRGEISLDAARERICFDTHHFARRQMGWFKRLPRLQFLDIAPGDSVEKIAKLAAMAGIE